MSTWGRCYALFLLLTGAVEFVFRVSGQCNNGGAFNLSAQNDTEGIIRSPNFPNNYNVNVHCEWVVRAPSIDGRVTLTVSLTALYPRNSNGRCHHYVKVRDGDNATSQVIVEWCGVENPESITSSGVALYVEFYSDDMTIPDGDDYAFYMTYYGFDVSTYCPPNWVHYFDMCYQLRGLAKQSWKAAQIMCTYDAANLVSIEDEYEDYFITDLIKDTIGRYLEDSTCVWIGLEDFSTTERSYLWVDGLNATYGGFSYDYYEDYSLYACTAVCFIDGYWDKRSCSSPYEYICKKRIDGTTERYPVPETADFSNGLEFVAIVIVAIMILIFIALIWSFVILNVKSCKKFRGKGDILIPSYSRVKENSINTDDQELPSNSDSIDSKKGATDVVGNAKDVAVRGTDSAKMETPECSRNTMDLQNISASSLQSVCDGQALIQQRSFSSAQNGTTGAAIELKPLGASIFKDALSRTTYHHLEKTTSLPETTDIPTPVCEHQSVLPQSKSGVFFV